MTRSDIAILIAVFVVAVAFVAASVSVTRQLVETRQAAQAPSPGTAGKPRDVDASKLERLIDAGHLSNHEADFYEASPP